MLSQSLACPESYSIPSLGGSRRPLFGSNSNANSRIAVNVNVSGVVFLSGFNGNDVGCTSDDWLSTKLSDWASRKRSLANVSKRAHYRRKLKFRLKRHG